MGWNRRAKYINPNWMIGDIEDEEKEDRYGPLFTKHSFPNMNELSYWNLIFHLLFPGTTGCMSK